MLGRAACLSVFTVFALLAAFVVVPVSADAATAPVITTDGTPLTVRSGPSTDDDAIGSLASGDQAEFSCYAEGTPVPGPYGESVIWDRLDSGGWVSDAWLYTGSDGPVVPRCDAQPPNVTTDLACVFNFRWPSLNLTVGYGGDHRYYGDAYQAVQDWNNAVPGMNLSLSMSTDADIQLRDVYVDAGRTAGSPGITFVSQYFNTADPNGAYHGVPYPLTTNTAPIEIQINQYAMATYGVKGPYRTAAITHEIGHALGLAHSDGCTTGPSIMKGGSPDYVRQMPRSIETYDAASIEQLYLSY